ncbi:hypothetical protein N7461_003495 [Penicillium sp. DV-2018c]|nr:hypothetical protein N7461_003495 [Penicillium sp. DV-2018c]
MVQETCRRLPALRECFQVVIVTAYQSALKSLTKPGWQSGQALIVKILQKADTMICDGIDLAFQWNAASEECEGRVAAKQAARSLVNMNQHHAPPPE